MSSDEMRDDEELETTTPIVLRAMVTGPEAGSIIGRKGESVKNMREESKAKIKIEGDSPMERIITVEGKTDSIFKAFTMICKILETRDRKEEKGRERSKSPHPDELDFKLLVPASQCGALIGKGGEQIKELRSKTGADIHINAEPLPGSTEREVKLKGKREQISKVIYHVVSLLLENPPKGEVRLYKPERTGRERERERSHRGERYPERDYDRDSYRMTGRLGRREDTPPRYAPNPFDAIIDFARRHDGGSAMGYRDKIMKHEMNVSNEQVGAVIGRKGTKISEIRAMSGATINILEAGSVKRERREYNGEPDRERVIEIQGTPEQLAIAKSLINVAVELAEGAGERRDNRRSDRDRSRSRDRGGRYDDRRRW